MTRLASKELFCNFQWALISPWGINLSHWRMLNFSATDSCEKMQQNPSERLQNCTWKIHFSSHFIVLFPPVCALCSLFWLHLIQGFAYPGQVLTLGTATQTQTIVSMKLVYFEKQLHFYPSKELLEYGVFSISSRDGLTPESLHRLTCSRPSSISFFQ